MNNTIRSILISLLVFLTVLTTGASPLLADESEPRRHPSDNYLVNETETEENGDTVSEGGGLVTTKAAYKAIIALKNKYPEGTTWNDNNYHYWYPQGTGYYDVYLYACYGWVAMCSDEAFGTTYHGEHPIKQYVIKHDYCSWCPMAPGSFTYSALRPGDVLRVNNNKHSVIILKKTSDYVIVSEGNYGGKVHWGRKLTKKEVLKADYVITRYPDPPVMTSATSMVGGVKVQWQADPYATKYKVYRRSETEKWTSLGTTENCYFVDTTANIDTYKYRVQSYSPQLLWSHYSDIVQTWHNCFTDLSESDECFDAVRWATRNKIVNGTTPTTFSPNDNCTRAQFCIMLWKLAGKPSVSGTCPFKDIDGVTANARKAIIWAYQKKIVKGKTATEFDPDGNITRAQLSVMLYKMARKPSVKNMENPFTDLGDYSGNVLNAIAWAYNKNIIGGTSASTFSPDVEGTRRLLVMMLCQYNKIYKLQPR